MKKILFIIALFGLLSSCLKEEIAIPVPPKGNSESYITTLNLTPNYLHQLFYNLEEKQTVLTTHRENWDVAFETSSEGYRVLINNGRMGGLAVLNTTDFAEITSYSGSWGYDPASSNLDSTFVGDWRNKNTIYLVDLGVNSLGLSMGKYKFRMLSVTEDAYTMEYCKLSETVPEKVTITKEKAYNFSLFSLKDGKQVTAENAPEKTAFDICLRTYTHVYPDGMPYLVVGCMLNDYKTSAAILNTTDFEGVTYADALSQTYAKNVDAIGFEWKIYDFDESMYSINPERVFIVKTQKEDYYKIRFLDFYNDQGIKGNAKLEIEHLHP